MSREKKSSPHDSARTHVQGLSEFIDDRPRLSNEVIVGLFYSEMAHAHVKHIDLSQALKVPGMIAAYSADDFIHNVWGTIFQDQPLLVQQTAQFVGEVILVLAATSQESIDRAKKLIRVDYDALPPVLSITEARKQKSFIGPERHIERGNVDEALARGPHLLKGNIVIQGAEHFYLESQAAVVYPREDGLLEVHSSAQHPAEVQHVVAHGLGLEAKDVVVVVKRMGGAFGGKESQAAPIAAYAALVAKKLGRPARLVLNKDEDMIMTGKRNPFENEYRVAYDDNGRILALEAQLYSDGGAYADLSTSIMERAMLHSDNAYFIEHMRVRGQVCRTNMHPHTAFRGFGGPKGVLMIEKILEEIAHALGKDALDLRKLNCYQGERCITHYGQKVENNMLPELFAACERDSAYRSRRLEVQAHNTRCFESGGDILRGLSMTAVKFGISFTTRFLNQGNALVNIYRDGSVQVSTGATEMGQGVYTRIATIVADELGVPLERVRVMSTSTEKNANTSPTAASSGTDINGAAAALACQQIKARLAELATKLFLKDPSTWASKTAGLGTEVELEVSPSSKAQDLFRRAMFHGVDFANGYAFLVADPSRRIAFSDLCNEAYLNRVSLSEYAHYKIPNLAFNKVKGQVGELQDGSLGGAFLYFTQGVAVSEVSVNRLTGEVKVLRTDILMDLGRPVNESLDRGQISGAFVQGLGWMTTENLFYSTCGKLLSHSPSTYKIPSVHDIPRDFRISLLPNDGNGVNVRGTKAVGEPPLLLAASVWTAVLDALRSNPAAIPRTQFPQLRVPATSERVLEALDPQAFGENYI